MNVIPQEVAPEAAPRVARRDPISNMKYPASLRSQMSDHSMPSIDLDLIAF
jgi:hypothetical protein